jgi:hypothetical protein
MRDHTVIDAVTKSLLALLSGRFLLGTTQVTVHAKPPDEVARSDNAVSLWLYRVARNPDVLGAPPPRLSDDELLRPPIPVDLHYLVTPRCKLAETEHRYLGRILQSFNDHAILRGPDLLPPLDATDALRVTLEAVALEDLTRIWTTLAEHYQPCLAYCVQLVRVPSAHEPVLTRPVERRETRYEQILEAGP